MSGGNKKKKKKQHKMCTKRFQVMDFLFCLLNEKKFSKGDRLVVRIQKHTDTDLSKLPCHLLCVDRRVSPPNVRSGPL